MSLDVGGFYAETGVLHTQQEPQHRRSHIPTTPRTAPLITAAVDAEPCGDASLTTAKVAVTTRFCGERGMSLKLMDESRSTTAEGIRGAALSYETELMDVAGGLRKSPEHTNKN